MKKLIILTSAIFGARHDAGLVREPARDNRNDDASDYEKYCAYAHVTVASQLSQTPQITAQT